MPRGLRRDNSAGKIECVAGLDNLSGPFVVDRREMKFPGQKSSESHSSKADTVCAARLGWRSDAVRDDHFAALARSIRSHKLGGEDPVPRFREVKYYSGEFV
jgi:hypothetical protein